MENKEMLVKIIIKWPDRYLGFKPSDSMQMPFTSGASGIISRLATPSFNEKGGGSLCVSLMNVKTVTPRLFISINANWIPARVVDGTTINRHWPQVSN